MVAKEALLVTRIKVVDRIPLPYPPVVRRQGRGRPQVYSDQLIVKALSIMVIRQRYTAYSLLAFLDQETALTQMLRGLLHEQGRLPRRRTWERRVGALPTTLPGWVGCLGRYLGQQLDPWQYSGRAVAIASTPLRATGGVWHQKDRAQGVVPHSTLDTAAHCSKSGHHGWG